MAYNCPGSEADFAEKVTSDLAIFVESSPVDSVLVFPPVNSFRRFLIHQLAQDSFDQLRTFSIGEDPDRRIVVCTKDLVARVDAARDEPQASVSTETASSKLTMVVGDADQSNNSKVRKSRSTLPTIGIYRPPAARRPSEESPKLLVSSTPDPSVIETCAKNAVKSSRPRVRRPDQQVYVPRAKRAFHDSDKFEDASASAVDDCSSLQISDIHTNESQDEGEVRSSSNLSLEDEPLKQRSFGPTGELLCSPSLVEDKCRLNSSLTTEDKKSAKQRPFSPTGEFPCSPSAEDKFRSNPGLIIEDKKQSKQRSFSPIGKFSRVPPSAEDKFISTPSPITEDKKPSKQRSYSPTGEFCRTPPSAEDKFRSNPSLIIEDKKPSKPRSFSPTGTFHSLPPRASQLVETKKKLCQSTSSDLDLGGIPVESERSPTMNSSQSGNLPPRAEVLVEKKKNLCHSSSLLEDYKWRVKQDKENSKVSADTAEHPSALQDKDSRTTCSKSVNSAVISGSKIVSVIDIKVTNDNAVSDTKKKCDIIELESSSQDSECNNSMMTSWISNDAAVTENTESESSVTKRVNQGAESSDEDYQDAKSNGLNNVSGGSSESLSSSDSVNASVSPVQLMKPVKTESKKKPSSNKPVRVFNPDECDWDALLDEDGDVLDPFLMKELASAVGEVQVTHPKSDYRGYKSQVPADHQRSRRSTADEDFGHVVEIFSFPPEFKTNDLVAVLSPFKNTAGGFEIKWVDDTHALGVFASALVAEQVLAYQHPMVRMRPLCDGTLESRLKARRLSESIQSFRPRPETCAALARRLVTGALGVKLPTARQEREEEKRVLKEAREKRRLAVQQQDDIWNS